jgi:hypothetical protein
MHGTQHALRTGFTEKELCSGLATLALVCGNRDAPHPPLCMWRRILEKGRYSSRWRVTVSVHIH